MNIKELKKILENFDEKTKVWVNIGKHMNDEINVVKKINTKAIGFKGDDFVIIGYVPKDFFGKKDLEGEYRNFA